MFTNRLANETSPYLQQHQHNPVDWYPWGAEAFEAARRQDKPIFLSIGYSTCYWCHVMERQSFENPEIAALMNEEFISIKVDREERPDVDMLYMTAVQVMTRQGGWPMSVWLLPDGRPFFGGTYFPPHDIEQRPGFFNVLTQLADAYDKHRSEIEKTGDKLKEVLVELSSPVTGDEPITVDSGVLEQLVRNSIVDYEPSFGGFGRAPKFPRQTLLELLLYWINYQNTVGNDVSDFLKPLRHTLDAMADGGIRDHVGGAFHRYSTDNQWLVPHFEIMLYDNAQLAWIYAEASRVFNEPRYENVARGILNFVQREMTSPEGVFYTAFDAEVDAQEGLYYLWTMSQIEEVLSPREAAQFASFYGVDRGPNFADPHGESAAPDKNVLYIPANHERESDPVLAAMRDRLYQHRLKRKKPLLDTKIITSWNAIMIRAFAHAGDLFGDATYLEAARRGINQLLTAHHTDDGGLYRTSRDGVKKHAALLEDYAYVADALLDLHRITKDAWCREEAIRITRAMRERFEDPYKGGFFSTDARTRDLIVRQKTGNDTPLPSANAVAAMACDRLGHTECAARAIGVFAHQAQHHPQQMSAQLQAMLEFVESHGELRVAPTESGPARIDTPQDQAVRMVEINHRWSGERQILIELNIAPGYHLSDNTGLGSPIDIIEHVAVPAPVRKKFAYSDEEQSVLEGRVKILVTLKNAPTIGTPIPMRINYQACNDTACLPTVTRGLNITR